MKSKAQFLINSLESDGLKHGITVVENLLILCSCIGRTMKFKER